MTEEEYEQLKIDKDSVCPHIAIRARIALSVFPTKDTVYDLESGLVEIENKIKAVMIEYAEEGE